MSDASAEVVAARAVTKVFGSDAAKVEALRGVDLSAASGEFVALMGASGSGKSTLLHLLAGLDRPTTGTVFVGGVDVAALNEAGRTLLRRRQVGIVFQDFNLIDVLTAEENVALPLAVAGRPAAESTRRARRILDEVGLKGRRTHRPEQLSGGEKQRVAVARALVVEPLVLLADEPTGNLDSVSAGQVLDLLRALADERRQTVVMATHDVVQARRADRLILLRDGRVEARTAFPAGRPNDHAKERGRETLDLCLSGNAGRPGRTLLTLLGIALGTAAVSATTLTNQAVRRAYRDLFERLVGPAALEAAAPGQGGFDPDCARRLAGVPGVKAVVPRIQAAAALVGPSGADPVLVVGAAFAGSPIRRPMGDEDILLDAGFLREHGLAVGDRVRLWTTGGLSELHVVGSLEADGKTALSGMPLARVSLPAAQRLFDLPHRVNSLQIVLEDGADQRRVAAEVAPRLPAGVGLQAPDARAEMAHATLLSTEQGLTCLGVAAMLGAGFVIFNTFLLNVGERRRQLATFRVIGATRGQVLRLLLGEAVVLGLAGTLLGAGGGLGLSVLLIRAMGRFMGVAPPAPHADAAFFLALLTGPVAAVAAALVPSWIAARREPLKELRMPRGGGTNLVPRWVCFPGVLLLAAAALGSGLSQGWLRPATAQRLLAPGVAALLIGGVLALPLVLTPLLRLFGWLLRPLLGMEGTFALRQMTGRGSRTGLTVGVLFLAVVMAVGFGHWLRGSLRDLRHWYTRTIVADYLIRGAMPDTAFLLATPLPEGLAGEIAGQEGVARVDKLSFVPARVNGRQVLVLARTFSTGGPLPLDLREGEGAAVRRGLMGGDAVLGVGLARSLRLGVGDVFTLETAHGTEPVRVAGTATEYAAGGGALYLEWGAARRLLDVSGAHIFLVSAGEGKTRPLQRSLKALCDRRHLLLQSNEALRVLIDGLLAKVVGALWAILALTFLIASLGMVNTLTLNVLEQAPDLRVLRVVGMTRGQIFRVVLSQAVLMGLAGLAPGTVVGLCLDYFLTSPGNPAALQPSPFRVDAAVIAVCWAAGLAAATLAALGPAFRACRPEAIQTTHSS